MTLLVKSQALFPCDTFGSLFELHDVPDFLCCPDRYRTSSNPLCGRPNAVLNDNVAASERVELLFLVLPSSISLQRRFVPAPARFIDRFDNSTGLACWNTSRKPWRLRCIPLPVDDQNLAGSYAAGKDAIFTGNSRTISACSLMEASREPGAADRGVW